LFSASIVTEKVTAVLGGACYAPAMSSSERSFPLPTPGQRITMLRQARGWSMEQLAQIAGTNRQRIWQLENGNTRLNETWMTRLAKAFGIKPAELLPDHQRDVVLSDDEKHLIAAYRGLSEATRPLLPGMIELLQKTG
jgi:transcriptional regulator with XRE-family HTH domain